jgi:G3E family GTPase
MYKKGALFPSSPSSDHQSRPRIFRMTRIACINGFLGAGKTTLMLRAADDLANRGLRTAIITNDQGRFLVDTARVRDSGFPVEEILGGCFCCRFSEFLERAQAIVDEHGPDIILAEAVGSCTDLAATVYRRLRHYPFAVAPLSVLVEPERIREFTRPVTPFTEDVKYLFGRQLAEADLILMNKSDLLEPCEIGTLTETVRSFAGDMPISIISAKAGDGVTQWVDQLLGEETRGRDLEVDYEIYAAAEASLGWLNATVDMVSSRRFSPKEIGDSLAAEVQRLCAGARFSIAHLKLMVITSDGCDYLALTNSGGARMWGKARRLPESTEASVIVNARVSAPPDELRRIVEDSLRVVSVEHGLEYKVEQCECFSPPPPKRDPSVAAHHSVR